MITNSDDLAFGMKCMTINEGSKCYMNNFIEVKMAVKFEWFFIVTASYLLSTQLSIHPILRSYRCKKL